MRNRVPEVQIHDAVQDIYFRGLALTRWKYASVNKPLEREQDLRNMYQSAKLFAEIKTVDSGKFLP